jgi:hypothetical protein
MKPEEKRSGRGSHQLAFPSKPERTTEYEFFISGAAGERGDNPEKKNAEENRGETGATLLGSREDVGKDL